MGSKIGRVAPNFIDLTGKRFGELTVINKAERPKGYRDGTFWNCSCDCGKINLLFTSRQLRDGHVTSCGHKNLLNLEGQKFGKLTVEKRIINEMGTNTAKWLCNCECGGSKVIYESNLVSGKTKTCGCRTMPRNREDLTGMVFGRLTVKSSYKVVVGKDTIWECLCICGNNINVCGNSLKSGNTKSCGCQDLESKQERGIDIVGKRFGKLTVIELVRKKTKNEKRERYWLCQCDCGNYTTVLSRSLRFGHTTSCGCAQLEAVKLDFSEATFNKVYGTYRKSAENRNLEFNLSKNDFIAITQQDCYYCGVSPRNVERSKYNNGNFIYSGIDRIDSSIGYLEDNIVPCCRNCNTMKMAMPLDEFFEKIKLIYEKHQLGGVK
jgi:hypothetical protein